MFLVHKTQVGIGVLSFSRAVMEKAGYDGWISVLLTALATHLIIVCMYRLLTKADGDLMKIHRQVFGDWLGNSLSFVVCVYFLCSGVSVIRSFIEIIQVWIYPDMPTWFMAVVAFIFFYYVIDGGFRTVAGLCFLGIILTLPLLPILFYPLQFSYFANFLPVWSHSFTDIALGAKEITFSFFGFELLLIYYPFLKNGQYTQKFAHIGAAYTTLYYFVIAVICFVFYSENLLKKTIWPTLTLFKVVELPFIERFEYVGISLWVLLITPNIALLLWAASRVGKDIFKMSQRKILIVALLVTTVLVTSLTTRQYIIWFTQWISEFGFYFAYVYIPLLTILQAIVLKVKKDGQTDEKTTAY